MEIGLLTAFIGGTLALLSPCGALLLPAFFASTLGSGARLWLHGLLFYAGLVLVLVPLGVGAGAIGLLFSTYREPVIAIASLLLIVLGVVQVLGLGFDPARMLPGARGLQNQAQVRTGMLKTVLLGAVGGIAGFCAGPILGAVLTMAATQDSLVLSGAMLAIYGAGMVVPLLVLASVWGRLGAKGRSVLRGRTFSVFGRRLHTTSVITGVLMVVVGVAFWTTNGFVGTPALLPTSTQAWLQERSAVLAHPALDVFAIVVAAVVVLLIWARLRKRRHQPIRQEAAKAAADQEDR
ncbi:cytochrome c biogenesis CcdA family protein [Pseudactinotalea sp. Z1739]|uniref:cytochrome c biogenesis CcdA family protein n=1 Tax=Pseudactinotalea sp. Z1739 TaxID=3413028 RepID=UPI003C7A6D95